VFGYLCISILTVLDRSVRSKGEGVVCCLLGEW
jgi:hypothetical protein